MSLRQTRGELERIERRYKAWRGATDYELRQRGIDPARITMREKTWRDLYINSKTPVEAADAGERHYRNMRASGRKR